MKTIAATVLLSCCSCCAFAQDKRAISAAEAQFMHSGPPKRGTRKGEPAATCCTIVS
jgi:hypothetical protein